MDHVRSLLYVPANKEEWVRNAPGEYVADGFIFDLEDSVPPSEKATARDIMGDALQQFNTDAVVTVRVNSAETNWFEADLEAVARSGLDAVVIPKCEDVQTVQRTAHVFSYLETVRNLDNRVEVIVLPETARGFYNIHDLCSASDRVSAAIGGTTRGADVQRALGFEWTREGTEKLHMLSKVLLDSRAAGVSQIFGGPCADVDDTARLQEEAQSLSGLGFTGYQAIHPSQIDSIHKVFTPDENDVEYYQRLVSELEGAEQFEQTGAIRFEGEMVDRAHLERAKLELDRARAFGVIK